MIRASIVQIARLILSRLEQEPLLLLFHLTRKPLSIRIEIISSCELILISSVIWIKFISPQNNLFLYCKSFELQIRCKWVRFKDSLAVPSIEKFFVKARLAASHERLLSRFSRESETGVSSSSLGLNRPILIEEQDFYETFFWLAAPPISIVFCLIRNAFRGCGGRTIRRDRGVQ